LAGISPLRVHHRRQGLWRSRPRDWNFGRKVLQAKLAKLETFIAQGVKEIAYVYDMGDDWRHTIAIEAIETADPGQKYSRFVDGARRGSRRMSAASRAITSSSMRWLSLATASIAE
jgi:hypothetical protein